MNNLLCELAQYLLDQQAVIIDRWMQICEVDEEVEVVSKLTKAEFRNNIPAAIEGLCAALQAGTDEEVLERIKAEVAKHGHHRWKQGFNLRELIRDWGNLNRVLVGTIEGFFREKHACDSDEHTAALVRLAKFIAQAMSNSVRRFDDLRRAQAAALANDLKITQRQFEELTQARGQLLREVAHDIRGGLSAIAGASAVLKLSQESNESVVELLDSLDRGVESVKSMLNGLLDLSRLESGADEVELVSVDIADMLERLAMEQSPVATDKGLELIADGAQELVVQTDPGKVRRIAQNLVINAIEHTSEGEVRLSWVLETRRWIMTISDTGPGIQDVAGSPVAREMDNEDSDHQASAPRKAQGYAGEGIGLAIVKRLCDMLDAGISLKSEMGRGTTITVEFPLDYDEARSDAHDDP